MRLVFRCCRVAKKEPFESSHSQMLIKFSKMRIMRNRHNPNKMMGICNHLNWKCRRLVWLSFRDRTNSCPLISLENEWLLIESTLCFLQCKIRKIKPTPKSILYIYIHAWFKNHPILHISKGKIQVSPLSGHLPPPKQSKQSQHVLTWLGHLINGLSMH